MVLSKAEKIMSIICSIIGFIVSSIFLVSEITEILFGGFGVYESFVLIPFSIIVYINILRDFLISIDKSKDGLKYAYISCIIKFILILLLILIFIRDSQLEYGTIQLENNIIAFVLMIIITIPSAFNIMKLKQRNNE